MVVDFPVEIESQPPKTQSMVTITHRHSEDLSIFPPINHEGLHNSSYPHSTTNTPKSPSDSSFSSTPSRPSSSSSLSSSTSISIDFDDSECISDSFKESPLATGIHQDCIHQFHEREARVQVSPYGWLLFGLEIMRRTIWNFTYVIRGCGASLVAAFRSFPMISTLIGVYVCSLLLKWIRLQRNPQLRINALVGVIREKDEKIMNLLDQIAQLNQVLLERQRS